MKAFSRPYHCQDRGAPGEPEEGVPTAPWGPLALPWVPLSLMGALLFPLKDMIVIMIMFVLVKANDHGHVHGKAMEYFLICFNVREAFSTGWVPDL